jgi:hypothetical protein
MTQASGQAQSGDLPALGRAVGQRWPLLALGAGLLIWYGPWLLAADVQMGGDVTTEFYPWLAYAVEELRRGALPLWGPYSMAGMPLLANPQAGLLYPLCWPLLLLLPVGPALNYSAAFHAALAGGATYWLARRWGLSQGAALFGATTYGFNGFVAARLWAGNLNFVQVAAWLPALLLAADSLREGWRWRGVAALTATLALSLLVGFYQLWFLGVLCAAGLLAALPGAWSTRTRRFAALACAGALAMALAAPQLLPAYELVRWSTRGDRLPWEFATDASLPPWHLLSLALPELFGNGAGTYWPGAWWHWHELTAYTGLLALVLLPLGLRAPREPWVRYCAALACVALLLALGRYTPLYGLFYAWMPGYGSFRDPARHLVLASLAAALLAARGADRLLAGRGRGAVLLGLTGIVLGGAVTAGGLAAASDALAPAVVPTLGAWGLWGDQAVSSGQAQVALGETVVLLAVRAVGLGVVAATLALVALVLGRRAPRPAATLLLVGATFADLTIFGWRYLHTPLPLAGDVAFGSLTEQIDEYLGPETVARLDSAGVLWRVAPLGQENVILGNAGYVLEVPLAIGLDPLLPRRYAELAAAVNGEPVESFQNVALFLQDRASPLWPLLNARYRLVPRGDLAADGSPRFALVEDPAALPRAFAVTRVRDVSDGPAALAALAEPAFDPRAAAVLEPPAVLLDGLPAAATQGAPSPSASVEITRYAPGDIDVTAEMPADGAVVLLEAWHPGWVAAAASTPVAVYPADYAFMAVRLPAGRHEVRFQFAPRSWPLGVAVAGGTLAAIAVSLLARGLWRAVGRRRSMRISDVRDA